MNQFKEWLKDGISALFWLIVILSIVLFSTDAFSQFIYTDF